jgi:AmiR/NasT family two-component response regulator
MWRGQKGQGMTETASTNGVSGHVFEQIATLEEENAQLQTALESRIILEQAKGAISARCDVTPEIAFEMMRGLARSQRRNLHEYAAEIVANGGRLDA